MMRIKHPHEYKKIMDFENEKIEDTDFNKQVN